MVPIILLHALFGSSIPMSKFLLSLTSPIWLTGVRMTLAGVLLFVYNRWNKVNFIFKKEHLWYYFQIILFGVYLKYILRNWGLSYMSASKMSFLLNITPFFAALFSFLAFKEKLSSKQWIGLFIGFAGIMPLLFISTPAEQVMGELLILSWPECAILFAVACHAYSIIVMRRLVRENNYSAAMANSIRMLGGGILAIITAYFIEGSLIIKDPVIFAGWLGILILASNVICHNLYIHLLKYYSATFISFTDFLSPIFTALYGWAFFNEVITWHYYLSGIIVFFGLILFYQEELMRTKIESKRTFLDVLPNWINRLIGS